LVLMAPAARRTIGAATAGVQGAGAGADFALFGPGGPWKKVSYVKSFTFATINAA